MNKRTHGPLFWWMPYTMNPPKTWDIPPMPEILPEAVEELVKAFKERYVPRKDSR